MAGVDVTGETRDKYTVLVEGLFFFWFEMLSTRKNFQAGRAEPHVSSLLLAGLSLPE